MTTTRTLSTLLAAACCLGPASAAQTVTCPAIFPMRTAHFVPTDDGWTPEPGERSSSLAGWGLYSGPPSQLAALQASAQRSGVMSWTLAPPYPQGVWVQCVYAEGALTLTRKLTLLTGVCTAPSQNTRRGKPQTVSFVCK